MSSQHVNNRIKVGSIIILGLILILGIFLANKKDDEQKEVINLKNEITKTQDEIQTMQVGQTEKVQIRFSWEVDGIKYNDALYLTQEQYEKLSESDIEKMKQQRFEHWAKSVNQQSKQ